MTTFGSQRNASMGLKLTSMGHNNDHLWVKTKLATMG